MTEPQPFGPYTLLRKIARGGMAELFLARGPVPGKGEDLLVIKRVLPTLTRDRDFLAMFLSEAKIAALLAHPNVVRVYDLGLELGELYLAMEFIDGADLRTIIKTLARPLPPGGVVRIASEICSALDYAHRATGLSGEPLHLIHRDVTAENVMVSRAGEVKLVDFGIAKASASIHQTAPGVVKGKLRSLSPEALMQEELDGRADVFSLGVLMYEALTAVRPFERKSLVEGMEAVMRLDPTPPRLVRPEVPESVSDLVMKALRKKREQRFQSAREMKAALEACLASVPGGTPADLGALVDEVRPPAQPAEKPGEKPAARPQVTAREVEEVENAIPTAQVPPARVKALINAADSRVKEKTSVLPQEQRQRLVDLTVPPEEELDANERPTIPRRSPIARLDLQGVEGADPWQAEDPSESEAQAAPTEYKPRPKASSDAWRAQDPSEPEAQAAPTEYKPRPKASSDAWRAQDPSEPEAPADATELRPPPKPAAAPAGAWQAEDPSEPDISSEPTEQRLPPPRAASPARAEPRAKPRPTSESRRPPASPGKAATHALGDDVNEPSTLVPRIASNRRTRMLLAIAAAATLAAGAGIGWLAFELSKKPAQQKVVFPAKP